MEKEKKKKQRKLIGLLGLALVVVVGGMWAYWSQVLTVENPFDTGEYGTTIIEDFNPNDGEDWQPGSEVNKDVFVENTGDQDVIVRIKLDEKWIYKGDTTPYATRLADDGAGGKGPVYNVFQDNATDGLTALDDSVVIKTFGTSTNWIDGGDGWYYYSVNVAGGNVTDQWLDSVTLKSDADMGKYETRKYVTAASSIAGLPIGTAGVDDPRTCWIEYTGTMPDTLSYSGTDYDVLHNKTETKYALDGGGNPLRGYGDSNYTLTITVQTVQATEDAVDAVFGGGSAFTPPAGTSWVLG
jgi:alternate signal-mediated exported protein